MYHDLKKIKTGDFGSNIVRGHVFEIPPFN